MIMAEAAQFGLMMAVCTGLYVGWIMWLIRRTDWSL